MNNNYKLIDKSDRATLREGRNKGFGGGFCKRDGDTFSTIMPISACGDFYAEVIHSEHTGKTWSVYGLNSSKQNIFDEKNGYAYLACKVLGINRGGKYNNFDRDVKALNDNVNHLLAFLNFFEKQFKSEKLTEIHPIGDNTYIFFVPLFWCQGTYLISLYKYLSRVGIFNDGTKEPLDFLNSFDAVDEDKMYWSTIKPKVELMLAGTIPIQKMTTQDSCPHNLGVVSFKFPSNEKTTDLIKPAIAKPVEAKKENIILNKTPAQKLQPMRF